MSSNSLLDKTHTPSTTGSPSRHAGAGNRETRRDNKESTPAPPPSIPPPQPNKQLPSMLQVSRPFYTASELSYLHSATIPDHKKIAYNQRKHQIFQFIFAVVKSLKLPLRVLNTTMNYYQRWYLFNRFEDLGNDDSLDAERDPFTVALTCLFLAAKNEDCIKKLRDILAVANKFRDLDQDGTSTPKPNGSTASSSNGNGATNPNSAFVEHQRKVIMSLEFKLLQIIKFDFINGSTTPSTDQLVVTFSKKLGLNYKITMYSWLMTFDIMSTPLCLIIPPHCIALAIIIVALNLKPRTVKTKYDEHNDPMDTDADPKAEAARADAIDDDLNDVLESIDCYADFKCPEPLVNEGIIYVLDYYIHQMNYSILNEYVPAVDPLSGKEQIFKFMDLKSRFNDLKILNEKSCIPRGMLTQDEYLKTWDYSVASKGSVRFMLGNKRRRFNHEFDVCHATTKSK